MPVIAYDQLIDEKGVFYVSFDAKQVGYSLAAGMLKYAPKGNYAILKGDKGDPNTLAMFGGFHAAEAIDAALKRAGKPHRFVVLPGADHQIAHEPDRAVLLGEIADFLGAQLTPGPDGKPAASP